MAEAVFRLSDGNTISFEVLSPDEAFEKIAEKMRERKKIFIKEYSYGGILSPVTGEK